MVIVLHINIILKNYKDHISVNYFYSFTETFSLIAVNTFVIIGSWFLSDKTKINFKNILKIYLTLSFWNMVNTSLGLGFNYLEHNLVNYLKLFFPFLTNSFYYVNNWIILSLFVPFLNILFFKITKKQFSCLVLLIIFLGPFWKFLSNFVIYNFDVNAFVPIINTGYSILSFIFLYIVTFYIKHHFNYQNIKWFLSLSIYFLIGIFFSFVMINFHDKNTKFILDYSNMYVWIMSFSIFLFFLNINKICFPDFFKKIILLLANCSLGVYINHWSVFSNCLRINLFNNMIDINFSYLLSWFILFLSTIIFCYLIEIVRLKLFYLTNLLFLFVKNKQINKIN